MGEISGKKFRRTNIVATKCGKEIVAPLSYQGTTDSELFEFWFENILLNEVAKGSVLVMDNASFHRKQRLAMLASVVGCEVMFLPPYSPDLNPIEKFWAWLKKRLRFVLSDFDCFDDALSDCFKLI